MKTLAEVLKELRELDEKATKGQWHQSLGHKEYRNCVTQTSHFTRDVWKIAECFHDGEIDAEFISKTRNYLPGLLQVIEKQREALDKVANGFFEDNKPWAKEVANDALAFDPFKEEK